MNYSITEIKKSARDNLRGKWQQVILLTFIYYISSLIVNLISADMSVANLISGLINFIIECLLVFGYMSMVLNISRGKSIDISVLFSGINKFFKAVGLVILQAIYVALWTLLLIVPGIMAVISYSMSYYIWVDNPDIGINEAIKRSKELTKGHKSEIFCLLLSFIGWILLVGIIAYIVKLFLPALFGFVFTLGMVFVQPYMSVSLATKYNELIKSNIAE